MSDCEYILNYIFVMKIRNLGINATLQRSMTLEVYDWLQSCMWCAYRHSRVDLTSAACLLAAIVWASWYWSIGKACILLTSQKHHKLDATLLAFAGMKWPSGIKADFFFNHMHVYISEIKMKPSQWWVAVKKNQLIKFNLCCFVL